MVLLKLNLYISQRARPGLSYSQTILPIVRTSVNKEVIVKTFVIRNPMVDAKVAKVVVIKPNY